MTKEELLNMELHEIGHITKGSWISILRVFGGWIYRFDPPQEIGYGIFVPESLNVETKSN